MNITKIHEQKCPLVGYFQCSVIYVGSNVYPHNKADGLKKAEFGN